MRGIQYRNDKVAAQVECWLRDKGELNLAHCDMTADDLAQLTSDLRVSRCVRTLRLTGNVAAMWLPAMPLIGRFPELRFLQLNACGLGNAEHVEDDLAEGLAACEALHCVGLGFNELSADMLRPVFERKHDLEFLDLAWNRLDDAYELALTLRPLTQLVELNLGVNDFQDCEVLSQGLTGMKWLRHLSLYDCVYLDDLTPLLWLLSENGGSLRSVDTRGCEAWEQRLREDPALSERNGLNAVKGRLLSIAMGSDSRPSSASRTVPLE